MTRPHFTWSDFDRDESTDAIPDKYVITVLDPDGEEFAVIVHRASERFPLDGEEAARKRRNARQIVAALNDFTGWDDPAFDIEEGT